MATSRNESKRVRNGLILLILIAIAASIAAYLSDMLWLFGW